MNETRHVSNWIDGSDATASLDRIQVINPATEDLIATVDATPAEVVHEVVENARRHFHDGKWAHTDASERFAVLSKAATLLRSRLDDFVALETQQTGRPVREMKAQLARVPEWLEYFASLARTHEGRVTPFKGPVVNTVVRLPLGVVALITPWNHPLLIAMKKIGAALAAGNTVIVKPSELAPLSVLKMGSLFQEAGLPDGSLQILSGYGGQTGKSLCESPNLARIDLTGGLATYQAIAPTAARNLTPITAELGGKAPVCIFPSTDIARAVQATLFASFIASGQTCVTGSRILIHEGVYEQFVSELTKRTKRLRIGSPSDMSTQIGAVIGSDSLTRCDGFVAKATREGGKLLCGGKRTTVYGKGFFFEPTLIETKPDSHLACHEVFGPVIALVKCESEDHIVRVANNTSYALGASIWTNDFTQAHRVAANVDAGIVWINAHHLNDPSSPWGGFKESGIGKENGIEAYESYTRLKSTIVNYGIVPTWFDEDENARYG